MGAVCVCVCGDRTVLLLESVHVIKSHRTRGRGTGRGRERETEKPSQNQIQIRSIVELIRCVSVIFLVLIPVLWLCKILWRASVGNGTWELSVLFLTTPCAS